MPRVVSYAQRLEDLYLLRCFEGQPHGFYIDVGSGHPVADNVSFAFYLRGWRGMLVEPNPHLARLSRAVRQRDTVCPVLAGATRGRATFYRIRDFHGLSTIVPENALRAESEFCKRSDSMELPVVTLRDLCAEHSPDSIDFLKIDVEGAERDVLSGADFDRFRPRVVLVEALAPYTLSPSWPEWEDLLVTQGYRFAFFDRLNRYYVATEAMSLADRFPAAPFEANEAAQFGVLGGAATDAAHPDHVLATLLSRGALTRLPLLSPETVFDFITCDMTADELAMPASSECLSTLWSRLLGQSFAPPRYDELNLDSCAKVGDLIRAIVASECFRIACGRISASYAW